MQYLCNKAKQLINKCFKEEIIDIISQGIFEIEPIKVKERINKKKIEILGDLLSNEKEPFLEIFALFFKPYFPKKLEEAQAFLEEEKIYFEEARSEREQLNHHILTFIDRFLESQSVKIYQRCIKRNQRNLVEYVIEKILNKSFKAQIVQVQASHRLLYIDQFEIQLPLRIMAFIQNIENQLREFYESQKPIPESRIGKFVRSNREDLILSILFLAVASILVGICYWLFNLPHLERFAFFNDNMWIAPFLVILGGIDLGLLIRPLGTVIQFVKKKIKSHLLVEYITH